MENYFYDPEHILLYITYSICIYLRTEHIHFTYTLHYTFYGVDDR